MWYPWRRLAPTEFKEEHAHQHQNKELPSMRLKLVLAASLLAAIVGAGSCIALVLLVFSQQALLSPGLLVASTFLLPIATTIFASIFVYRHTARRRRLQAFLTAILAVLLTIALFIGASILSARKNPNQLPEPGQQIAS